MRSIIILALSSLTFMACGQAKMNPDHAESDAFESYGSIITSEEATSFDQMLAQLEGQDSLEVKVSGVINTVCRVKGCWMNVSQPGMEDAAFVKFKDYGFFVPKDSDGKEVIMQGVAYKDVTPVDELRHYAEDEGKSKEEIAAITEPKEELKFMATGVLLKK